MTNATAPKTATVLAEIVRDRATVTHDATTVTISITTDGHTRPEYRLTFDGSPHVMLELPHIGHRVGYLPVMDILITVARAMQNLGPQDDPESVNLLDDPARTYTSLQVDRHGYPLLGAPVRQYSATNPADAARLAAAAILGETKPLTVEHRKDWPMGGTYTLTPATGAPVYVRVTVPEAEPALRATTAPEPVTYVTIDPTSPNWAPAVALSAALDATEEPEAPARTCEACEEPIEFYEGTGWVEIARDGHYDICPDRYIEATDTQRGHVPAPVAKV